jgi:hypothetical protein
MGSKSDKKSTDNLKKIIILEELKNDNGKVNFDKLKECLRDIKSRGLKQRMKKKIDRRVNGGPK